MSEEPKIEDVGHGHLQMDGREGSEDYLGPSLVFRPLGTFFELGYEAQELCAEDAIRLLRRAGYAITPPDKLNASWPWDDEVRIPQ